MFHKNLLTAITLIATFVLAACAPAATAPTAPLVDPTMVSLKATLVAEATADVEPCQVQSPPAWRFFLTTSSPMFVGDTVFTVNGNVVAVNVPGEGPWRLQFGFPVQLGPFTGLCFILSGENIVLVEGSSEITPPRGAPQLVP